MGRIAKNNRPFITELFWIFSTGAAWPDLAERYGDGAIPPVDLLGGEIRVVNDRDKFDQSYPHASAAVKENQKMSRTKGSSTQNYIWPWIRWSADQNDYCDRHNRRLLSS